MPSFLALVGAATAVGFGASKDFALAGGAINQVLQGGKAYYVPQQKAAILDHALDAILCIKTESMGIPAFTTDDQERVRYLASGTVKVSVEEQYFHMVAASLLSVERAMAQRLSGLGNPDPAGVIAEIEKLAKEREDAKRNLVGKTRANADFATLALDDLRPRLQTCVTRAKVA